MKESAHSYTSLGFESPPEETEFSEIQKYLLTRMAQCRQSPRRTWGTGTSPLSPTKPAKLPGPSGSASSPVK